MGKRTNTKAVNERTGIVNSSITSRYKKLKGDIQAAKEGRLNLEQLKHLMGELTKPVKISDTVSVEIEDCHPSTGRYKRALPKGYLTDTTKISKIITEAEEVQAKQVQLKSVKPVDLEIPDPEKMNENMFLMIEEYLAHPSKKLASKIKQFSHDLTNLAYEEAKTKFPPGKKIGADEYAPIILEKIEAQAEEAMSYSIRMIRNGAYDPETDDIDKPYIFKVSKDQQEKVRELTDQLMSEKKHPEGLIFAFGGYIERRSASKFSHLEGKEATAYDHNAKLYLKAKELVERGEYQVAGIVMQGCNQIKSELNSSLDQQQKFSNIKHILIELRDNPRVQEHRGTLKTIIVNFLLMASGVGSIYLAATMEQRGSFFYRPQTDTENKAEDFEKDMDKEGPTPPSSQ
ncbi:hypothetical protein [Legionella maioricensis]|uniref:Uncharacterized protein n=1 Tax=Legionella maioricensis TaxID=2896528 RepID=A0A9X2IAE5_9GAMM|nr:hypothetical protein [Legionella maioricensis]MCL9683585.1 hypothetical protein [Legionella maioricensis]MCL9686884.1 hypothetical protein [Legionella maioricensis]